MTRASLQWAVSMLAAILAAALAAGCDTLASIAPPPAATLAPSQTFTPAATATVTPTPGPREFIDAAFYAASVIDVGTFDIIRFFVDGTVLDVHVSPFSDCLDAWRAMRSQLTLENQMAVRHGEYFLSAGQVHYELAAPNSTNPAGEATGQIVGSKLTLTKSGDTVEYIQVGLND